MKRIAQPVLVLILFLSSFVFCQLYGQDRIYWQENRPLNFKDFKGKPNYKSIAALSYCGIKFVSCNGGSSPTYEVYSYFEPINSWVWGNYKFPYVIKHEQLHFDIAEIYARKLRKYFSENNVSLRNARKVYDEIYAEYEDFQEKYDLETAHGTNSKNQKLWNEKIRHNLNSLNKYSEQKCY